MVKRSVHIDEARARALREEAGSWRQVAQIMGVGYTTLRERLCLNSQARGYDAIPRFVHDVGGVVPDPLASSSRRYAPDAIYDPARDGEPVYESAFAEHMGDPPVGRRELLEAHAARTERKVGAPPTKVWHF